MVIVHVAWQGELYWYLHTAFTQRPSLSFSFDFIAVICCAFATDRISAISLPYGIVVILSLFMCWKTFFNKFQIWIRRSWTRSCVWTGGESSRPLPKKMTATLVDPMVISRPARLPVPSTPVRLRQKSFKVGLIRFIPLCFTIVAWLFRSDIEYPFCSTLFVFSYFSTSSPYIECYRRPVSWNSTRQSSSIVIWKDVLFLICMNMHVRTSVSLSSFIFKISAIRSRRTHTSGWLDIWTTLKLSQGNVCLRMVSE